MKYARELKVGALALVCVFLLYFGFYYLKGVNIFSSVRSFHGQYENVSGLQKQAPVYVKGFKVGQVDDIHYDFARDTSFIVDISVRKDIRIPDGTRMNIISDGLLGGTAIQLDIPTGIIEKEYQEDDFIPTSVIPGLLANLQDSVTGSVGALVRHTDSLILCVQNQLKGDHLYNTLSNVDQVSENLIYVSNDLKGLVQNDVPGIVVKVDSTMTGIAEIVDDVRKANINTILANIDTSVFAVKTVLTTPNGTVGKLLNDNELYSHVDATVLSVDSLMTDLKANPKRYVHFSLFGPRNKKK